MTCLQNSASCVEWAVNSVVKFRTFNISGNISKSLEVIMSIISISIADIPGSRAKNKLFFLNTTYKVKA